MDGISSLHDVECKRCHPALSAGRIVQPCVMSATECEAFATDFLRSKQSQVCYFDDCRSLAFCGSRRGAIVLGAARSSNSKAQQDSKIQHRKGWTRSRRTVATLSTLTCSCSRMQPGREGQRLLHAVLAAHSVGPWLVAPEWILRLGSLCLSQRAATRPLRAWLPE